MAAHFLLSMAKGNKRDQHNKKSAKKLSHGRKAVASAGDPSTKSFRPASDTAAGIAGSHGNQPATSRGPSSIADGVDGATTQSESI